MQKGCNKNNLSILKQEDNQESIGNNIFLKDKNPTQLNQKEKYFYIVKQKKDDNFKYNQYYVNNEIQRENYFFPNDFLTFGNNNIYRQNNFNSFPISINNNFNNFQKNKKFRKKNQIILIINNYINIENPLPKNETINKEKDIGNDSESKENKFESPSISTINSSKVQINQNKNDSSTIKFIVAKNNFDEKSEMKFKFINKKRGRKSSKKGKREHSAFDQDNIIRKIQVHYISFIIDFTNDVIQNILIDNKDLIFKSINYEFKKIVNHSYLEKLNFLNIGDILKLKISPKIKKFNENINELIFNRLCNMNAFFKKFFETSYLDTFNKYYYQNEREVDIDGTKIKLSGRSKLFFDLLAKNKESADKIKEIAEEYFVNKRKNPSQIFLIKKI